MVTRKAPRKWLYPSDGSEPWIRALQDIDRHDDKTGLVELLKSKQPMSDKVRWHVADLLERYQLKLMHGGRGGRRTPSYDYSPTEAQLKAALESLRKGTPIEQVTRVYGVNEETLRDY